MISSTERSQIQSYLSLPDDDLVVMAARDSVQHGFLRNRIKMAREKVTGAIDAARNHVCSNEAVRRAHSNHADDHALIAALLLALPVAFLKDNGISDALAFSILVARAGLSNLCRPVWTSP